MVYRHSDGELKMEIVFVVFSNLFGLFGIVRAYRNGLYSASVLGLWCILSSTMYHIGDTTRQRILGMNPGQWHRLDNIFIISAVQYLWIIVFDTQEDILIRFHVLDEHEKKELKKNQPTLLYPDAPYYFNRRSVREGIFIAFFSFTIWCQEFAPWNEFFTFFPIISCFFFNYPFRYYLCTPKYFRPVFDFKQLGLGLLCLAVGLYFFVKGLDDGNDYLRINHGMWHIFVAFAVFHIQGAKQYRNPKELFSFHRRKYKKMV